MEDVADLVRIAETLSGLAFERKLCIFRGLLLLLLFVPEFQMLGAFLCIGEAVESPRPAPKAGLGAADREIKLSVMLALDHLTIPKGFGGRLYGLGCAHKISRE